MVVAYDYKRGEKRGTVAAAQPVRLQRRGHGRSAIA